MSRRRRGDHDLTSFTNEVRKAIRKALKTIGSKCTNKSHETPDMVGTLKEAESFTVTVFESLLSFTAGPKLQSKSMNWSIISKLVQPKRVACVADQEADTNELERIDAALVSLLSLKRCKSDYNIQIENAQTWLGELEASILDLEEGTEYISRRLIKTRVSLLNIFNH